MEYASIKDARQHGFRFADIENDILLSARIIRYYKQCGEPTSPSLRVEIERYSKLMQSLNEQYKIPGCLIFYNWNTGRLNARPIQKKNQNSLSTYRS